MKKVTGLLALFLAGSANAGLVSYTDFSSWSANSAGVVVNDFNHYTSIQYFGQSYVESGVTFAAGALFGQGNNTYAGSQWIGEKWFSFEQGQPYNMNFGQNLSALSFDFADYYNANMNLTLLFNTGESITVNQGGANSLGFFGITTDTAFSSVQLISSNTQGPFFGIDNLAYGSSNSVPEPVGVALLGLGLAGIGFARKRKAV